VPYKANTATVPKSGRKNKYQARLYKETLAMFDKVEGFSGISPWILVDFYSPRRQLNGIQDWFNRKGIISNNGVKKQAFFELQDFYMKKAEEYK